MEQIRLRSDLAEIARLNDWLVQCRDSLPLPRASFDDIKLCLNEIVTNAISYGFGETHEQGEIHVALGVHSDQAVATVIDNGIAFNPLEVPVQDAMTGIESAQIGGFGLMLVRKTADSLSYAREAGQNRLTMAFKTDQSGPVGS